MNHLIVEFRQKVQSSCLSLRQVWLRHEVLQGVMVSDDLELLAFEVVPPSPQCMYHSQEFSFMSWVVRLCRIHLSALKCHRMITRFVDLTQHSSHRRVTPIACHNIFLIWISCLQYWSFGQLGLKLLESCILA